MALFAAACLLLFAPGHGAAPTPEVSSRETGAERLARMRARVRSKLVRKGGGAPDRLEPVSQGALTIGAATAPPAHSPEVQANSGISGTQSETAIAVLGSHVVVGYNQLDPSHTNRGSGAAYSIDGGLTFVDDGGLPVGNNQQLVGDPSVTACGNGTFYYGSIYFPNATDSALAVSVGTFSPTKLTWTLPKQAAISTPDFLDKPWVTCDRATNTLYMIYTRFVNFNINLAGPLQVEIIKSVDGGTTWSAPVVLQSSATESVQIGYLAIGPNSEVYTLWERGVDDITAVNTQLELRRSFNFGATFDPKVVVRVMTPSFYPAMVGFNREDTLEIGTVAADTSSTATRGNVYVIWVERESPGVPARDVFVARSIDQGATWSAPVRVNDDRPGNDQVMPWVSVNADGTLEAFWYDYRNWAGMHTVDVYAARSTDGGQSFGPNFRVTTVPTSWFVPATFTPNFGDYIQCASEAGGFYPSWADGRNNDIDVYVSHVPTLTCGNGITDPFEQCDDGNTADGDSCSGACATTLCGNGTLDAGEECDDGNIRSGDGCSETCRREVCGDGIVQPTNKEECDDGNLTSGDGCSASCLIEPDTMAWIADERSRLALESVTTGRTLQIGDPGFHELGDLAFDAAGRLFGATQYNPNLSIGFDGDLISMTPLGLPGRGALLGDTGWLAVTAIDFHPVTGALYGISVDAGGISRLITINPVNGLTLSTVGSLGLTSARAMAFDAAGTLYVATTSLYTVNPATAAKTLVGGPISGTVALAGMDFAPDGTLYGVALRGGVAADGTAADGGLLRIDKTTGAGTLLFTTGRPNQQGIRFAPPIALDHDGDGVHDIVDCAPADPTNPPPGLASDLNFTNATTFTWSAAPGARFHNSYRGTITDYLGHRLPGNVFDQVCLESADAQQNGDLVSSDTASPPLNTVFYYVIDGENPCGEGKLDSDPAHPIPNTSPCPTPP